MSKSNVRIKPEVEKELREYFRKIRENKLLVIGVSIGIIGSLIAGIINDLIRDSSFYPLKYLLVLTVILIILVVMLLVPYFNWKMFQRKIKKRIKEHKKILDMYEEHKKRYPPRR